MRILASELAQVFQCDVGVAGLPEIRRRPKPVGLLLRNPPTPPNPEGAICPT